MNSSQTAIQKHLANGLDPRDVQYLVSRPLNAPHKQPEAVPFNGSLISIE